MLSILLLFFVPLNDVFVHLIELFGFKLLNKVSEGSFHIPPPSFVDIKSIVCILLTNKSSNQEVNRGEIKQK